MVYQPTPQLAVAARYNMHHGADGKFASGSGSGGGESGGEGDANPAYPGGQPGANFLGVDPHGVSYTEHDINADTGQPKFSQAYRDKYGPIADSHQIGESDHHLVTTESGGIHIANDSHGAMHREVVQEFSKKQADSLGDDIYAVNVHGGSRVNGATGVKTEAQGRPGLDGHHATKITFANGSSLNLDADSTFELQGALLVAAGSHAKLGLDGPHAHASRHQRGNPHHDSKGRFSSGDGVRQTLADANDTKELSAAAAAEAKRITGQDIAFDMTGADLDVAKQHSEGIMRGLERFPDAGLAGVHTYGPDRPLSGAGKEQNDWAGVTRSHGEVVDGKFVMRSNVYFNTGVAAGELQSNLRESAKSGYLVSGTPMGTALHEYGHVVAVSRGSARDVYDHAVARSEAAGASPRYYITKHVSGYAASSMGEYSAEIFADVMEHGHNASELSKTSFAIIEGGGA